MALKYLENTKKTIQEMQNFFMDLEKNKKQLEEELNKKELEQSDLLHEMELSRLNAIELMNTAKRLVKLRKERRVIKDILEVLKTEKGFADKYINKGICADLKQNVMNLDNLKKCWSDRKYHPKILKDLKINKIQEKSEEK